MVEADDIECLEELRGLRFPFVIRYAGQTTRERNPYPKIPSKGVALDTEVICH